MVFDQSWRLLTASERDVLSRLSVFRGTIAPDAARSVAGASLPVLGALVDKSLLRKEGMRLAMHPLVQQLAAARLDDERGRVTRAAHATHFLNGLAQLAARTEEGDRGTLQAIDADLENCRQAWLQATADDQVEALMRAAPALHDYFDHRARFDDGLAWFRGALEALRARTNPGVRARLLGVVAHLEFRLARFPQAEATAREAMSSAPSDDAIARFRALAVLASCAMDTGRLKEAARRFEEALAIARDAGLARDLASSLENLALVHKRLGRYDESLSLSLDALSQHRRNGDTAAVALCLSNLGSLTMFMGQAEAAAKHLDEALVLSERAGLASTRAFVLANMTELAMNAHNDARARQLAERALEVADGAGIRPLASWLKVQLARLAIRRGDLDHARAASRRPPISRWPSPRPFPRRRRSWRSRSSWRPGGTRPSGGACSPSACSSRSCPRPRATSCARRGRPAAWSRARMPAGPISRWTSSCNASWRKRSSTTRRCGRR